VADEEEEPTFELLVPFTCVESEGGPYNDKAFAAGWQLGAAWQLLQQHKDVWTESVLLFYPDLAHQVDLMAMQFGFMTSVVGESEDFIHVLIMNPN